MAHNTLFTVTFGGTNWGQTAEPTVYTSYDYGAGMLHMWVFCYVHFVDRL